MGNGLFKWGGFMIVQLTRASLSDAETIWRMQVRAFTELLERYQDFDTSPARESLERLRAKMSQAHRHYYFIQADGADAGVICVVADAATGRKRISPIFVMPEFRNLGIAQAAIRAAEAIYGADNWFLDTIQQEAGNCHLYEKLGYRLTGETRAVNQRMTLVYYEK